MIWKAIRGLFMRTPFLLTSGPMAARADQPLATSTIFIAKAASNNICEAIELSMGWQLKFHG